MNEVLKSNNILTELYWEPANLTELEPATQALFRGMTKGNRKLQYRDGDGKAATGYSSKISTLYEPFAIYVKELYGDGIYFAHEDDNSTYLLIVSNGRIVGGTDCFVDRMLFSELINHGNTYANLEVTPLTELQIDAVIERCKARQVFLKRRRRFFISSIFIGGIILLMVLALALHFWVAG